MPPRKQGFSYRKGSKSQRAQSKPHGTEKAVSALPPQSAHVSLMSRRVSSRAFRVTHRCARLTPRAHPTDRSCDSLGAGRRGALATMTTTRAALQVARPRNHPGGSSGTRVLQSFTNHVGSQVAGLRWATTSRWRSRGSVGRRTVRQRLPRELSAQRAALPTKRRCHRSPRRSLLFAARPPRPRVMANRARP